MSIDPVVYTVVIGYKLLFLGYKVEVKITLFLKDMFVFKEVIFLYF